MALGSEAPEHNPTETVSESTASNGEAKETPPILRTEFQIPQPVIDSYNAQQGKTQRLERWKLMIEGLTLIAVIGYGLAAYFQLSEMRENVRITKQSADQAKRAADVAEATLESIHRSSRLDQRAWVGIKSTTLKGQIEKGGKVQAAFIVTNSGKTPGLEIVVKTWAGTEMPTEKILSATASPENPLAIPPSGEVTFWIDLSETDVKQIIEGKINFYIAGIITYYDVFREKTRRTRFCRMYNKNITDRLQFCPSFNDMD